MAARVTQFCRTHHVEILYAFGSRAKQALSALSGPPAGHANPDSDLDIGVLASLDARIDVREKALMVVELAGDCAPLERERLALIEAALQKATSSSTSLPPTRKVPR
jgi:hypothetical protein